MERIFEPFFTTKETGKGTGLGLPTSHSIVEGRRGFITVYSEEGWHGRRTPCLMDGGERILVVDDEESVRVMVGRTLTRFGYRVEMAKNGAEAAARVEGEPGGFDVVLTDMAMPVMDGAALVAALQHVDANLAVIGTSGLEMSDKIRQSRELGMRHFVQKPFAAEKLLRLLREVLEGN